MHFSKIIAPLAMVAVAQACFLTVHSSKVGNWKVQHSEPKDHGGAPQTISGSKGSCHFSGALHDGCGVSIRSNSGCGSLSFTRNGNGKREDDEFEAEIEAEIEA